MRTVLLALAVLAAAAAPAAAASPSLVAPAEVFPAFRDTGAVPADASIAIGTHGIGVIAVNSRAALFRPQLRHRDGDTVFLPDASCALPAAASMDRGFDPRVVYLPQAPGFALVWLSGRTFSTSHVHVAFSRSSTPKDMTIASWNDISHGSPAVSLARHPSLKLKKGVADYPSVAASTEHVFVSFNLLGSVRSGSQDVGYGARILALSLDSLRGCGMRCAIKSMSVATPHLPDQLRVPVYHITFALRWDTQDADVVTAVAITDPSHLAVFDVSVSSEQRTALLPVAQAVDIPRITSLESIYQLYPAVGNVDPGDVRIADPVWHAGSVWVLHALPAGNVAAPFGAAMSLRWYQLVQHDVTGAWNIAAAGDVIGLASDASDSAPTALSLFFPAFSVHTRAAYAPGGRVSVVDIVASCASSSVPVTLCRAQIVDPRHNTTHVARPTLPLAPPVQGYKQRRWGDYVSAVWNDATSSVWVHHLRAVGPKQWQSVLLPLPSLADATSTSLPPAMPVPAAVWTADTRPAVVSAAACIGAQIGQEFNRTRIVRWDTVEARATCAALVRSAAEIPLHWTADVAVTLGLDVVVLTQQSVSISITGVACDPATPHTPAFRAVWTVEHSGIFRVVLQHSSWFLMPGLDVTRYQGPSTTECVDHLRVELLSGPARLDVFFVSAEQRQPSMPVTHDQLEDALPWLWSLFLPTLGIVAGAASWLLQRRRRRRRPRRSSTAAWQAV